VDQRPHQIESQNVSFCNVTIISWFAQIKNRL